VRLGCGFGALVDFTRVLTVTETNPTNPDEKGGEHVASAARNEGQEGGEG
jgi:hypothetical protein